MNFELNDEDKIYITDAVSLEISSTEIRTKIRENTEGWRDNVPFEVANYIEKYKVY